MKEKRRDNKGRILHTGESQRTDGKYLYKYVDAFGNTKYVYAWRLTPTDPTPKGKREKPSLRELEQQIRRDIEDGIDSTGKKMTLCQLYAKQNAQRANVKKSTQKQREQLMRLLKEDKLGARSIDTIKPSDAKEWALRMKDKGFSYNTINNHKRSLKASFYIAIQDDYVRKNPFDFKLCIKIFQCDIPIIIRRVETADISKVLHKGLSGIDNCIVFLLILLPELIKCGICCLDQLLHFSFI